MYENAQYMFSTLSNQTTGIRVDINGVTSCVPMDPANADYANIMRLVAEGKLTIAPAE
jgi:hypothetical protein